MGKWTIEGVSGLALGSLLWSCNACAAEATVSAMSEFQEAFGKIVQDKGDAFAEYERLQSLYARMASKEKAKTAQLLSMTDAMFGRYQDAEDHFYAAFYAAPKPVSCPATGVTPEPALAVVHNLAAEAQVVMINESHSMVSTRVFLYDLLPVLRALGFKYLAMEALAPGSDEPAHGQSMRALRDSTLPSRGYPLDQSAAGFYLREPIYAEMVREAIAQGFILVAYDTRQAKSRDEREVGQASALAKNLTLFLKKSTRPLFADVHPQKVL